jgi:hypothetical protein
MGIRTTLLTRVSACWGANAFAGQLGCETADMEPVLTVQQVFDAMRIFLSRFNEREPPERRLTLEQLLSWTEQGQRDDPLATSDPAQWQDWLAAVDRVVNDEP